MERVPRAPTSCASTRGRPPSETTTWAARLTSSTCSRRTPTAPARVLPNGNPASNSSGGDYWFIYKDVLFIDLNSNSSTRRAGRRRRRGAHRLRHRRRQGSTAPRPRARCWSTTTRSTRRRPRRRTGTTRSAAVDFPTAFSKLGVDLVLQGHDHVYTRSYEIKNGAKANPDEKPGRGRGVHRSGRRRLRDGELGVRIEVLRHHQLRLERHERRGQRRGPAQPEQLLGQLGAGPGARAHVRQGRA